MHKQIQQFLDRQTDTINEMFEKNLALDQDHLIQDLISLEDLEGYKQCFKDEFEVLDGAIMSLAENINQNINPIFGKFALSNVAKDGNIHTVLINKFKDDEVSGNLSAGYSYNNESYHIAGNFTGFHLACTNDKEQRLLYRNMNTNRIVFNFKSYSAAILELRDEPREDKLSLECIFTITEYEKKGSEKAKLIMHRSEDTPIDVFISKCMQEIFDLIEKYYLMQDYDPYSSFYI